MIVGKKFLQDTKDLFSVINVKRRWVHCIITKQ